MPVTRDSAEGALEIFDPATGELRRETSNWDTNAVALGYSRYRINKPNGYHFDARWDTEQPGDIVVGNRRSYNGTGDHAVVARHCDGLKLEDVTLYASPCFGFLEIGCNGTVYRHCKIDRRPPDADFLQRGLPRYRSLNADAFHSIDATKGPAIIGCTARFQGDDCVNIHGTYCLVMASHGKQIRAVAARQPAIEPGDEVSFIPYQGERPPDAKAVKIEPDEPIEASEREFIQKLPLDKHIRQALLGPQAHFFKVTLDRPVTLAMGSGLCASQRQGNGCVVRDCDFGWNRSRGIIIKASRAKVIGNKITHTWMTGVLASPEFFWWLEAGLPDHLEICDNTIVGCRGPGIEVTARGGDGRPLPAGAVRGVTIRGNTVVHSVRPNIHVTSTVGLLLKENRFSPVDDAAMLPPLSAPWNWGAAQPVDVLLEK